MASLQTLHQERKGLRSGGIGHQQSHVWSASLHTLSQTFSNAHSYKRKASVYCKSCPAKVPACRHQQ